MLQQILRLLKHMQQKMPYFSFLQRAELGCETPGA
jgi:hypothetical protein